MLHEQALPHKRLELLLGRSDPIHRFVGLQTVHCTGCFIILWTEVRVCYLQLLLQLLYNHNVVKILGGKLSLGLLLARHLLLLQFLHFELELIEVECALFFRPVKLLAVELLKATILFDSFL